MHALCLLNHELTENQILELKENRGCGSVLYPPEELKRLWAQLPSDDISENLLEPFIEWIDGNSAAGTVIVIQGEFGATFALVDRCLAKGLVPVHSVTKRVAEETRIGEEVRRSYIFKHLRFREYKRIL